MSGNEEMKEGKRIGFAKDDVYPSLLPWRLRRLRAQ
jgi:hypothetical protein